MRNIQNDDLKLAMQIYFLNKNSQGDVIEKGNSLALGVEISNNDLK